MELEHYEQIGNIEGCPLENESGEIKLFRCVANPMASSSFQPYAIVKPHLKNKCLAWGLSTYKNLNSALQTLNNLSKKKQNDYNAIAVCVVKNEDGIKHQSLDNKYHYTFYPKKDFDFLNNFKLVEDDK